MVKNHDFLTIFGKNSAKNRKKTPFFHEKSIFFAFFCKKKHSGVRPLFLQNWRLVNSRPQTPPPVSIENLTEKKNHFFFLPAKKFSLKFFYANFFFYKKKIFLS